MTEIHAAVPHSIAKEVKEAQMRGDDQAPHLDALAQKSAAKSKDKDRVKVTPSSSKVQRLSAEDEENTRRQGTTQEPESDPESDWIPRPDQTGRPTVVRRGNNNIFGIKGLDETVQHDVQPERVFTTHRLPAASEESEGDETSDPFITVTSKGNARVDNSDLRRPVTITLPTSKHVQSIATDTPELLKFSHQNPFSAIQPNNQTHPLFREFSYAWEESEIMHDTGLTHNRVNRMENRKRMANDDFERRRSWEMKRFKEAGCDLARYNRGDFGPRTGVGRL